MRTLIAVSRHISWNETIQKYQTKEVYKNIDGEDTFYDIAFKNHEAADEARAYTESKLGLKNEEGFPITILYEDR